MGRAGANPFLRGRLRRALAERVAASGAVAATEVATAPARDTPRAARPASAPATYAAFPDDWFLRRGEFERGAIHDAAWAAELDMVTRWIDGLPLAGRIVEPAAGVGFFSPLLAEKGELFAYDADGEALDRARDRLVAHRLRAHLHVADPFTAAPGAVAGVAAADAIGAGVDAIGAVAAAAPAGDADADVVVAAFLLGRVRGAGLDLAATSLHGRLREGGRLALVDLRPDPAGGPPPWIAWTWHDPTVVEAALRRAGFGDLDLTVTGRFFLAVSALAR